MTQKAERKIRENENNEEYLLGFRDLKLVSHLAVLGSGDAGVDELIRDDSHSCVRDDTGMA